MMNLIGRASVADEARWRTYNLIAWRILPLLLAGYTMASLDRVNVAGSCSWVHGHGDYVGPPQGKRQSSRPGPAASPMSAVPVEKPHASGFASGPNRRIYASQKK